MKLSILIPAYNESATIQSILLKVNEFAKQRTDLETEIVVVNDCSTDQTVACVEQFCLQHPEADIRLFTQPRNGGKGLAIRRAIAESTGDILVVQDADLEYDPMDFNEMLPYILSGEYQVVYGSRFLNHNNKHSYQTFYLGGRLVSLTANILYGLHLTDEPTCYKMFTRQVIQQINLKCTGFEFCPEVTAKIAKLHYHIHEVPIHYYPRSIAEGKKINWKDGVEALWTLLKYRFTN